MFFVCYFYFVMSFILSDTLSWGDSSYSYEEGDGLIYRVTGFNLY